MDAYKLIKPFLFRMDPEPAHHLTLGMMQRFGGLMPRTRIEKPVELLGLTFPNPVGLAAGLDKDGVAVGALGKVGFGFLEVGTVTPKPQPGNPKPRLFRLPPAQAVINRMGFNNGGVDELVDRLKQRRFDGVLGVNIGKNKVTPNEQAVDDYRTCLQRVYDVADYIAVNISSPNTPGLRELQGKDELRHLLTELDQARSVEAERSGRRVPLLVKLAPDLSDDALRQALDAIVGAGMDGLIATNTTIARSAVEGMTHGTEAGGLSGAPVRERSTEVIAIARKHLGLTVPIVGVGGIFSAADALEKREAGADLVQLYTGLIYRGPALVREIATAW